MDCDVNVVIGYAVNKSRWEINVYTQEDVVMRVGKCGNQNKIPLVCIKFLYLG